MHFAKIIILIFSALFTLMQCGTHSQPDQHQSKINSRFLDSPNRAPSVIKVCWLEDQYQIEKTWITAVVRETISYYSPIDFEYLGVCHQGMDLNNMLKITFERCHDLVSTDCRNSSGETQVLVWNQGLFPQMTFNFNHCRNISGRMGQLNKEKLYEQCVKFLTVHEFYHFIGFGHEHQRESYKGYVCYGIEQTDERPYVESGKYDDFSIVNYCRSFLDMKRTYHLTPNDIIAMQNVYGQRRSPPYASSIWPELPEHYVFKNLFKTFLNGKIEGQYTNSLSATQLINAYGNASVSTCRISCLQFNDRCKAAYFDWSTRKCQHFVAGIGLKTDAENSPTHITSSLNSSAKLDVYANVDLINSDEGHVFLDLDDCYNYIVSCKKLNKKCLGFVWNKKQNFCIIKNQSAQGFVKKHHSDWIAFILNG